MRHYIHDLPYLQQKRRGKEVKTRMDRAMSDDWREEPSFKNINEAIKLARKIKIIDIIDPTTHIRHDLAEIVSRLHNADKLEIIDLQDFSGNINTYS